MNFLFKFVKKLNRMTRPVIIIVLLQLLMAGHACAQEKTRPMAVAGSFYAADPDVLRKDLEFLFSRAEPRSINAGYTFSGEVAATSYRQVDPGRKFQNIFLIGPSHRYAFNGAAIYQSGDFKTPLGIVPVNHDLARELTDQEPVFILNDAAHLNEHSLEVQLPFLQYYLEKDFKIVPVLDILNSKAILPGERF